MHEEHNTHSPECTLRHKEMQNTAELVKELHTAIIGDISKPDEYGLCTKINLLFKDFEEKHQMVKSILITGIITIVTFIFWCGYQYHILITHSQQIEALENAIIRLEKTHLK